MIRRAVPADIPAIAHVHVTAWQTSYQGIVPDQILANLTLLQYIDRWQHFMQTSPLVWVAEHAGQIVGFSQVGEAREPIIEPYTAELNTIYILPTMHGHGFGRQLFEAAVEAIKPQHRGMMLWVLKDNLEARGFYAHLGGVFLSEKPTHMGDPPLLKVAYGFRF